MDQEFTIDIPHRLYFSTRKAVSVKEVIKSLQGLENVIKCSKSSLERVYDTELQKVELYIQQIEEGSLTEDILIRLFFKDKKSLNKFLDKCRDKVGNEKMKWLGATLGVVIGAGLLVGLFNANRTQLNENSNNQTTINLTNNYYGNSVWKEGAELTNQSSDEFRKQIEKETRSQIKTLAQGAIDTITPARNDKNSTLTLSSENVAVKINSQMIKNAPEGKLEFKTLEHSDTFLDVDLEIRALDLDSNTKGWAGVIPNIVTKRVKIEVKDGVDTSKLKINVKVRANVIVEYTMDKMSGKSVPSLIVLEELL
ncbi:MAG: hypothetical protein ACTTIY_08970 [Haemophilus parainfluenzae]